MLITPPRFLKQKAMNLEKFMAPAHFKQRKKNNLTFKMEKSSLWFFLFLKGHSEKVNWPEQQKMDASPTMKMGY